MTGATHDEIAASRVDEMVRTGLTSRLSCQVCCGAIRSSHTMKLQLELIPTSVELVDATALLVPVDGQLCRLGGAISGALRRALPAEERADELAYVEDELARLRPIPHPQARLVDGVARWEKLLVSAAYPHSVDGVIYAPEDCARMIRSALPAAIGAAYAEGVGSLAATLIGTAYRMPPDLAVRAFVDGIRAAAGHALVIRWSLPDPAHYRLAAAAAARLGIPTRSMRPV